MNRAAIRPLLPFRGPRFCRHPGHQVLALLLILVTLNACGTAPDPATIIPTYETSDLESRVAAKIARINANVIADPSSAAGWGRLGKVFHAHALYPQALACYRQAAALDADDYRWPYLAALTLAGSDLAAALPEFERVVALAPANEAVYIAAADTLSAGGQPERAAESCRSALAVAPGSPHANLCLGRLAVGSGDLDLAREHLTAAVAAGPRLGQAHRLLATICRRQQNLECAGRHEEMARAFPAVLQPEDPALQEMRAEAVNSRSYTERGRKLAAQGRYAEAEQQFREVLRIRPANVRDLTNLGGALAGQNRVEEAIGFFHQALALDADDAVAHNNLGMALRGLGRTEEAEKEIRSAIGLDPAYAEAQHNLGLVLAGAGRSEAAIEALERAVALAPGLAAAHNDLATALASNGRIDEAIAVWIRALDFAQNDPSLRYNLSLVLIGEGRHAEAIDHLRLGLETAPNSSRFASLLAWELATAPDAELHDADEAMTLARRVVDARPDDPSAADVHAAALAANGDFDAARASAERALGLARTTGHRELAEQIAARLELYRLSRPFRQPLPEATEASGKA